MFSPKSSLKTLASLLLVLTVTPSVVSGYGESKMLLSDVQALTLRRGKDTRGRRSTVPQLDCISGPCHETPAVVQCRNVGSDGYDSQWKCEAEMKDGISFDQSSLVVSCEGYDHPNDPYITAGSCGLQYSLIDRRDHNHYGSSSSYGGGYGHHHHSDSGYSSAYNYNHSSGFGVWGFVFLALVIYIAYAACSSSNRQRQRRGGGYGGDGGPGGGPGFGNGNDTDTDQGRTAAAEEDR